MRLKCMEMCVCVCVVAAGPFTLSDGSPAPFTDQFGVVYNATYQAPETGTYSFRVGSDDGFLFSVGGSLLLSDISFNGFQVITIAIAMTSSTPASLPQFRRLVYLPLARRP